jgi:protease-4
MAVDTYEHAMGFRNLVGRIARSYVTFIVIGLVVGALLAPVAYDATSTTTGGTVAVVPLDGTIDGLAADAVIASLERARNDPDVKAVVIVSNSGGGGASASEELYMEVKRTADQMPVVASVGSSAASGAYYTISPAERIFVKPSSVVGSVGVVATAPTEVEPIDVVATTGPNKLSSDDREFYYLLDSLGNAFLDAVFTQRGDRIELTREEVKQARIFSGLQAVENGMADEVGGTTDAAAHAANLADLDRYDTRVIRSSPNARFLSKANYVASSAPNKEMVSPEMFVADPGGPPTFLMLPASYVEAAADDAAAASTTAGSREVRNATY